MFKTIFIGIQRASGTASHILLITFFSFFCFSQSASAATINVSVFAGGAFGADGSGIANTVGTQSGSSLSGSALTQQAFVQAGTVQAGDVVFLTATGNIMIGSGLQTNFGPDGTVIPPSLTSHTSVLGNLFGALVGSLVPDAIANTPGFVAFDAADVMTGIAASSVFLVGSSLTFTATQSGILYLGVTDSTFSDNTGDGFAVDFSIRRAAVPEPGSLVLLSLGLLGLAAIRRKR